LDKSEKYDVVELGCAATLAQIVKSNNKIQNYSHTSGRLLGEK
jgi:hypothetical protein